MVPSAGADAGPAELTEHLAALWRSGAAGVVLGRGETVTGANEAFVRTLGRSHDTVVGAGWTGIVPAEDVERDGILLDQLLRSDSSTVVLDLLDAKGVRVPVLVCAVVVDRETAAWVAVVVDLRQDDQLRRMAEADAAIVSTLLEDAPVGFALISPDLRFLRVNRELAAMNGHSVAEHLGRGVFDIVPQLQATAQPLLEHVLRSGEPLREVEIVGETTADPGVQHTWSESFFPVRSRTGAVVGVAAIARDDTEVRRLQTELADVAEQRRQALEELQRGLLPRELPAVPGYDLAARYSPAQQELRLGGDWYDVLRGRDGRVTVCVGDAVGHGLRAIGLMARASGALHAWTSQRLDPSTVLGHLDTLLTTDGGDEDVATAVVVRLDPSDGTVEHSSAGHPYPLVRSPDGRVRALTGAQGPLLGARAASLAGDGFPTDRWVLEPGGALLLYTDGLVERRDESLTVGMRRAAEAMATTPPDASAEELVDTVLAACLGGVVPREDDVCLVALVRPA